MNRRPVTSANIASVGFEEDEAQDGRGVLEVEFRSGHVYRYAEVPESEYRSLIGADSVGRYFNAHIKDKFEAMRA